MLSMTAMSKDNLCQQALDTVIYALNVMLPISQKQTSNQSF